MSSFYNYLVNKYILFIVDCASVTNKRILRLNNFNMGEIPAGVAECRELVKLYLQQNKISYLPEAIEVLINLEILNLNCNMLKSLPSTFWNLQNLVELNLAHNPLKKLPQEIKMLKNLEILWLNSCELTELPEELCDLEFLVTFGARNNSIAALPINFYKLNLRWLTLTCNKLSCLPTNFKLAYLIHCNLSNNEFTAIPYELTHLSNLRFCFLKANKISYINNVSVLTEMAHVVKIDLSDNPLSSSDHIKSFNNVVLTKPNDDLSDDDSDWESSIHSSDIDLSSESEDEEDHEINLPPFTAKYFLS